MELNHNLSRSLETQCARRKCRLVLFGLYVFIVNTGLLQAATITMTNGKTVDGTVVAVSGGNVTLRTGDGSVIKIPSNRVRINIADWVLEARNLHRSGSSSAAEELCRQILLLEPGHTEARQLLSGILSAPGYVKPGPSPTPAAASGTTGATGSGAGTTAQPAMAVKRALSAGESQSLETAFWTAVLKDWGRGRLSGVDSNTTASGDKAIEGHPVEMKPGTVLQQRFKLVSVLQFTMQSTDDDLRKALELEDEHAEHDVDSNGKSGKPTRNFSLRARAIKGPIYVQLLEPLSTDSLILPTNTLLMRAAGGRWSEVEESRARVRVPGTQALFKQY
jgi:hypothetical protein